MNKRKTLIFLCLVLVTGFTTNHSASANDDSSKVENHLLLRCDGANNVSADQQESEPNNSFSQANLVTLTQGVCSTPFGHAGPRDSEYYGTKWCVDGSYFLNVCTGDETVISDLYRIDVSKFSKIRIETLADNSYGNIGFVVFQSNGDRFTDFYFPGTSSNYREETLRFPAGSYYIGVTARKSPDNYFLTAEWIDERPGLSFCSNGLDEAACKAEDTAMFILNNRNINKGISLILDKTNFSSSDSCNITSSNRFITVNPTITSGFFDQTIRVKANKSYANSLLKQGQTASVTITTSCTNGIKIELPVLLSR
jgi:hypothetical protein